MFGHKRKIFLIVCVVFVAALFSGFKTLANTAFTYKQPIVGPDIYVDIYNPDKAYNGTALFADYHKPERPRIIEVNMRGEIVWEYLLPVYLREYIHPGFDVELLPNNNILFVAPRKGVYEINRDGKIVWSYEDEKISHNADRLPNGNTLIVERIKIFEVIPDGEVVWQLRVRGVSGTKRDFEKFFYKAERISPH